MALGVGLKVLKHTASHNMPDHTKAHAQLHKLPIIIHNVAFSTTMCVVLDLSTLAEFVFHVSKVPCKLGRDIQPEIKIALTINCSNSLIDTLINDSGRNCFYTSDGACHH